VNIRELIEQLEQMAQEHGEECNVLIASQPSWPFEHEVGQLVAVQPEAEEFYETEEAALAAEAEGDERPTTIYLAEGQQIGYLVGAAQSELGWGR